MNIDRLLQSLIALWTLESVKQRHRASQITETHCKHRCYVCNKGTEHNSVGDLIILLPKPNFATASEDTVVARTDPSETAATEQKNSPVRCLKHRALFLCSVAAVSGGSSLASAMHQLAAILSALSYSSSLWRKWEHFIVRALSQVQFNEIRERTLPKYCGKHCTKEAFILTFPRCWVIVWQIVWFGRSNETHTRGELADYANYTWLGEFHLF